MALSLVMNGMPFDSKLVDGVYDRAAFASDFSQYFASMFSNGILVRSALGETLTTQLKATSVADKINIGAGSIIINGRVGWILQDVQLDTEPNSVDSTRIDIVVAELSTEQDIRAFSLKVVKGVNGSSSRPNLIRTNTVHQMLLADVMWNPNSTSPASVIDKREDTSLCGLAKLVLGAKTISGIDEIKLVSEEPTDTESQANPRVLYMWGE